MPTWLPPVVATLFWTFLLLTVFTRLLRLARAMRTGLITREAFTVHVTADFISIGVGVGVAFCVHRLIAEWIFWGGLAGFLAYFVSAVITSALIARIYQRVVDGRVRRFLEAGSADPAIEEGPAS